MNTNNPKTQDLPTEKTGGKPSIAIKFMEIIDGIICILAGIAIIIYLWQQWGVPFPGEIPFIKLAIGLAGISALELGFKKIH